MEYKIVKRDVKKSRIEKDADDRVWVVEDNPEPGVISRSFTVVDPDNDSRINKEEVTEVKRLKR